MGNVLRLAAAIGALVIVAGACVPPPQPTAPLVVTTTADTFDGVCDLDDCSLRDAIAASNALAPVNGVPNRITVPAGSYTLSPTSPLEVLRPVAITGAGAGVTTLQLGGPLVAPSGVLLARTALTVNSMSVTDAAGSPSHVLASCDPTQPRTVNLLNVVTSGLVATAAYCDTNVVNSVVTGPATVLAPFAFSASNSTLPFHSAPIDPVRFTLVSSIVTGPSDEDGSIQNTTINVQARDGAVNQPVNLTGTRLVGVGLRVGGDAPGSRSLNVLMSSFGLTGPEGPVAITVGTGSNARFVTSTLYGGGSGGAVVVDGSLLAESITATTNGPVFAPGSGATVQARRSILAAGSGATCASPIESLGRNVVVGSSCVLAATDLSVASTAALLLDGLDRWGNPAPSLHRLPLEGSPVLDVIPPGPVADPDCPTDANGGRSIDARGVVRPQGAGCDAGALELAVTVPAD